jgi:ABC-2 type transport system permease protein
MSTNHATSAPSPFDARADLPIRLSRRFSISAWLTLFRISVIQFIRGRRLLALALLFLLPTVLALLERHFNPHHDEEVAQTEEILIFYMIPQALVPLSALILASGMIRDEVEGQTLTYLLIRPLPRPLIYAAKLLAAWCVSAALSAVFITAALAAVHWGADDFWGTILPIRAARVSALSALSLMVYVALFGGLSLLVRWVLPFGVAYTVMFEGVFANIDFMVRRLTVLWYVRILAERWLGLHVDSWSINLDEAPSGVEALLTLLIAAIVLGAGGGLLFGWREIRLKTPEGG